MIELFGKEFEYKDYDCSYNPSKFDKRIPTFNLYVQATNICQAKCAFCDKPANQVKYDFDTKKFYYVVKELNSKNLLARVSVTGGEPFTNINALNDILVTVRNINPNIKLTVNTNGYDLEYAAALKYFIDELHISRHHYNNTINDSIFNEAMPSMDEIKSFTKYFGSDKIRLNCVLLKGYNDDINTIKQYLEVVAGSGIHNVKFLSIMPLTEEAKQYYSDPDVLIEQFKDCTNDGFLYDKDICKCFDAMYITSKGVPVQVTIRNTFKHKCEYIRQLIYSPDNHLLTGFGGEIII
jgi:molybdenum cofactor biosynthesis enzyme MoaA